MYAKNILGAGLILLATTLSGCGPGMPFMTGEQEQLVVNVEKLLKENEALKKRVSELEGRSASSDLKKDIDAIKVSVAEANMGLEKVRQEFSFVKGSSEDAEHEKTNLKEAIRSIEAAIASIHQKMASIEASGKASEKALSELRSAVESNEKKITELKEQTANLEKAPSTVDVSKKEPADADALYAKGYKETQEKDFHAAAETFKSFLSQYPSHKYASNAQYWLGEVYYAQGELEKAILEFDKVRKKYPKGEKVAASILKQGFSFEKLGSKKEAVVLLKEVIERFPGTTEASMAKKRLDSLK